MHWMKIHAFNENQNRDILQWLQPIMLNVKKNLWMGPGMERGRLPARIAVGEICFCKEVVIYASINLICEERVSFNFMFHLNNVVITPG